MATAIKEMEMTEKPVAKPTAKKTDKPSAGKKFTDGAKATAGKVGDTAKGAAGKVSDGAKNVGKSVKKHPVKTAAAVGGVAAAVGGAVLGKKYYDKRQEKNAGAQDAKTAVEKATTSKAPPADKLKK